MPRLATSTRTRRRILRARQASAGKTNARGWDVFEKMLDEQETFLGT
jgi:hypothetical protein